MKVVVHYHQYEEDNNLCYNLLLRVLVVGYYLHDNHHVEVVVVDVDLDYVDEIDKVVVGILDCSLEVVEVAGDTLYHQAGRDLITANKHSFEFHERR